MKRDEKNAPPPGLKSIADRPVLEQLRTVHEHLLHDRPPRRLLDLLKAARHRKPPN